MRQADSAAADRREERHFVIVAQWRLQPAGETGVVSVEVDQDGGAERGAVEDGAAKPAAVTSRERFKQIGERRRSGLDASLAFAGQFADGGVVAHDHVDPSGLSRKV
jgi:hypothetical protein